MLRFIYQYEQAHGISTWNLYDAVDLFYNKHKVKPTSIKISMSAGNALLNSMAGVTNPVIKSSKGGIYLTTIAGPIKLDLLDGEAADISINQPPSGSPTYSYSFIVVESNEVDSAFEKQILES